MVIAHTLTARLPLPLRYTAIDAIITPLPLPLVMAATALHGGYATLMAADATVALLLLIALPTLLILATTHCY